MQLIQSIRQLEALHGEWNALAERSGQALLRHEWFLCAAKAFHDNDEMSILVTRRGGRLCAIAPLVRSSITGVERLEFVGAASLHEPCGFLYEDEAAHAALIEEVLHLEQPLMLLRVPAEARRLLEGGRSRRRGLMIGRPTTRSLGIRLGSTASLATSLPGKLRYDLKRAGTRASEQGTVSFEALAPRRTEVDELFNRLVAVEGSGWKGRRQSALARKPRLETFFRSYARTAAEAGTLRLFFLQIGDATVAAQMAVEVYQRLWVLKIGYDESRARCSPGLLLTSRAVEYSIARKLRSYEFLGVAEPWEERWQPEPREHGLVAFYPRTLNGCLSASRDVAAAAWQRLMPSPQHAN